MSQKIIYLTKRKFLYNNLMVWAGGLFGMLLCFIVTSLDKKAESAMMGIFFAITAACICMLFNAISLKRNFTLALFMSRTRREIIVAELISNVITAINVLLDFLLIALLEIKLTNLLYTGKRTCQIDFTNIIHTLLSAPLNFVFIVLCMVSLTIIMGALYVKYSNNIFWVIYIIYMLAIFLSGKIADFIMSRPNLMDTINHLINMSKMWGGYFYQTILTFILVLLAGIGCLSLRKQAVLQQ